MSKDKPKIDPDIKAKEVLEQWFAIQQNSIAGVQHALDFCIQHANLNVSENCMNTLERNVVVLCKKVHTISQYQRCINSFFEACSHSCVSCFELQNKKNQKDIEKIKIFLCTLIMIIQDNMKTLSLKMHYSALFCSQLEKKPQKHTT